MNWICLIAIISLINYTLGKHTTNQQAFLNNIRSFNKNSNDPKYFCSTNSRTKPDYWVLRNKKCYNFSDQAIPYEDAFNLCKQNLFAYTYLIHRNELEFLQENRANELVGVDFYQVYVKLFQAIAVSPKKSSLNESKHANITTASPKPKPIPEINIWLNDNFYTKYAHECDKHKGYVAIAKFDNHKCKHGCYSCVLKKDKSHLAYAVCVKSCEWKVSYDSFCNSENATNFFVENNLYYQANQQSYICQGKNKSF